MKYINQLILNLLEVKNGTHPYPLLWSFDFSYFFQGANNIIERNNKKRRNKNLKQ